MPTRHKLFETHPIIITVMNGTIDFHDVRANCNVVDNYLRRYRLSKVYWIMDAVKISYSRQTAIQIAEATKHAMPGSGGDPRVIPFVIMPEERYEPMEDELKNRHFTLRYPLFPSVHDAYSFALFLINNEGGDRGKIV